MEDKKIDMVATAKKKNNTEYCSKEVNLAFLVLINYKTKNVKHKASEKPRINEDVLVKLTEDNAWHCATFNGNCFDIEETDEKYERSVQPTEVSCWIYPNDLLDKS